MPNQGKKKDVHEGAAKKAQRKDSNPTQAEQAKETVGRPPVSDRAMPEEKAFAGVPEGALPDERLADTDELAQTGRDAEHEDEKAS